MSSRITRVAMVLAGAAALSACSTYDGYGRNHVSVGVGNAYPSSYYGWYGDYYYPGSGYYIYDRRGTRHRWNSAQRRYWQARRSNSRARENWSGYHYQRRDYRGDRREYRDDHRRYRDDRHRGDDRRDRRSRHD